MTFTAIFIMVFLVAFVLLAGLAMYLAKTIDHGEARFDSESGKTLPKVSTFDEPAGRVGEPPENPTPAKRIEPGEKDAGADTSGDA